VLEVLAPPANLSRGKQLGGDDLLALNHALSLTPITECRAPPKSCRAVPAALIHVGDLCCYRAGPSYGETQPARVEVWLSWR
jgi:hypothetical protein